MTLRVAVHWKTRAVRSETRQLKFKFVGFCKAPPIPLYHRCICTAQLNCMENCTELTALTAQFLHHYRSKRSPFCIVHNGPTRNVCNKKSSTYDTSEISQIKIPRARRRKGSKRGTKACDLFLDPFPACLGGEPRSILNQSKARHKGPFSGPL